MLRGLMLPARSRPEADVMRGVDKLASLVGSDGDETNVDVDDIIECIREAMQPPCAPAIMTEVIAAVRKLSRRRWRRTELGQTTRCRCLNAPFLSPTGFLNVSRSSPRGALGIMPATTRGRATTGACACRVAPDPPSAQAVGGGERQGCHAPSGSSAVNRSRPPRSARRSNASR